MGWVSGVAPLILQRSNAIARGHHHRPSMYRLAESQKSKIPSGIAAQAAGSQTGQRAGGLGNPKSKERGRAGVLLISRPARRPAGPPHSHSGQPGSRREKERTRGAKRQGKPKNRWFNCLVRAPWRSPLLPFWYTTTTVQFWRSTTCRTFRGIPERVTLAQPSQYPATMQMSTTQMLLMEEGMVLSISPSRRIQVPRRRLSRVSQLIRPNRYRRKRKRRRVWRAARTTTIKSSTSTRKDISTT